MTSTQINTGQDVVEFLNGQHEQIKALFLQVTESSGEAKNDSFIALRRLLAVHEAAEEEVVHPRAERIIPNGKEIIGARLHEENEAKQTLARLEDLDPESAEFETLLRELQADVLQHAEAEEQQEFAAMLDRARDLLSGKTADAG